ncbi:Luciferin 4-monooxygenase [Camponotus japonicus]
MRAVVERAGCSTGRHNRHLHSQSLGIIRTTLLAALYVGAISNPWDNELSPTTARFFLSLTRSKIVFANVESIECLARIVEEDHLD